jgi:hypothetical protein
MSVDKVAEIGLHNFLVGSCRGREKKGKYLREGRKMEEKHTCNRLKRSRSRAGDNIIAGAKKVTNTGRKRLHTRRFF